MNGMLQIDEFLSIFSFLFPFFEMVFFLNYIEITDC